MRIPIAGLLAAVLVGLVALPASAQVKSLAGTYQLTAAQIIETSGAVKPMYGKGEPRGLLIMTPEGRYVLSIVAAGLPKIMAGSRGNATPQEKDAIVDGSVSHFGTYTLAETGRSVTLVVQGSTFPNWEGQRVTMPVSVAGDQVKFRIGKSDAGGTADLTFRKLK